MLIADPLLNPLLGIDPGDGTDFLTELRLGGWGRDSELGGSGDSILASLLGGDVYATLVAEGNTIQGLIRKMGAITNATADCAPAPRTKSSHSRSPTARPAPGGQPPTAGRQREI